MNDADKKALEAAERLLEIARGASSNEVYPGDGNVDDQYTYDLERVSSWAIRRIKADEAETLERAKPIDAEWLRSLLGDSWVIRHETPTVAVWRIATSETGVGIGIEAGGSTIVFPDLVRKRGQLLDLIRALKGGA